MTRRQDVVEDLLVDSSHLLDGVEDVGALTADLDKSAMVPSDQDKRRKLESLAREMVLRIDGDAVVEVSRDEMTCRLSLFPPQAGGLPVLKDRVAELLQEHGAVAGISWETVEDAIYRCNTECRPLADLVVARGKAPVAEVPGHLVPARDAFHHDREAASPDGALDHREAAALPVVREGELLAEPVPTVHGEMGFTVRGQALPYKKTQSRPRSSPATTLC